MLEGQQCKEKQRDLKDQKWPMIFPNFPRMSEGNEPLEALKKNTKASKDNLSCANAKTIHNATCILGH